MNKTSLRCLVPLLVLWPLSAQTPVKTAALPQSAGAGAPTPVDTVHYQLGPDDQLRIWVLGADEVTDKPVRVTPEGYLDLPVVGRVHAAGMTLEQLKSTLVARFSKELLHPLVSVEIVEFGSQPVSV